MMEKENANDQAPAVGSRGATTSSAGRSSFWAGLNTVPAESSPPDDATDATTAAPAGDPGDHGGAT